MAIKIGFRAKFKVINNVSLMKFIIRICAIDILITFYNCFDIKNLYFAVFNIKFIELQYKIYK